jgi:hypothetical protein
VRSVGYARDSRSMKTASCQHSDCAEARSQWGYSALLAKPLGLEDVRYIVNCCDFNRPTVEQSDSANLDAR